MPIPLFNSIASWILKKRIHQMELFMKYPNEVQNELLHELIKTASKTEIGKLYDFKTIKSYDVFKSRVPLCSYDDIELDIERCRQGEQNLFWPSSIKWFAKSSGTTNSKSKFIPLSNEALEDCHYKAGKDMLSLYFNNNEDSQLLTGKSLRLGGSNELYNKNDSYFGDLSSIIIQNLPFWAELSSTPSNKTSLMPEWESKMKAIVTESISKKVTSLAGVPSWMLVLLQNVLKKTGKKTISEVWPDAEVYFHGGVSFKPYRELYKGLFTKPNFRFYEIYNASEGFFAIQDQKISKEMLLMLDYGIFYEFISKEDLDNKVNNYISLEDVKKDIDYAMIISTNSGLWRYHIGDIVSFTSTNPYRIIIKGRTKNCINTFGEELMVYNTDVAIFEACKKTNSKITDYTVAPIYMSDNSGRHEWAIEFEKQPEELQNFIEIVDEKLKSINSDYEAKRFKNLILDKPKITNIKTGIFYNWLKQKNKLGGQNKIERLKEGRDFINELKNLNS